MHEAGVAQQIIDVCAGQLEGWRREITAVGLELPILALIPGLGNVAWRPASDLR